MDAGAQFGLEHRYWGSWSSLLTCLMMISGDADSFFNRVVTSTNWTVYRLLDDTLSISQTPVSHLFIRIPMAAIFFVMLTAMTVLPRPRNLENLLANSTALVVAAQMWYPDDIGTYVQWYMPLFLLVSISSASGSIYAAGDDRTAGNIRSSGQRFGRFAIDSRDVAVEPVSLAIRFVPANYLCFADSERLLVFESGMNRRNAECLIPVESRALGLKVQDCND